MAQGTGPLGFQMDPIPIPKGADQQPAPAQLTPPPQEPGVYYGGKTGAAAHIADRMLSGWLTGVHMGNINREKKAANEIGSAKTGVDIIGNAYRAAVESGDQAKIAEAKKALTEAWTDYVNKAEKYAIPEQGKGKDGKKQGTGSRIKEGLKSTFMGADPQIMAQSTIDIMKKADPTSLYGPSASEKKQQEYIDLQYATAKDEAERKKQENQREDRWRQLHEKEPSQWNDQDKRFNENYEYQRFGKSPAEQQKDQLLGKIMSGAQLNDQERELGEQLGLLKPKVTSTQIATMADENGNPFNSIIAIGPDGKMVGQPQRIPGKMYVPPNQAQLAGQVLSAQVGALVRIAGKAHPEWDEKTKYQFAMQSVTAPGSRATEDWFQKNEEMQVMNRAIAGVLKNHTKSQDGQPFVDEFGKTLHMFAQQDPSSGMYVWTPLSPQESGMLWWKQNKFGDMDEATARRMEGELRNELRVELKKQNKKLSDTDIEKMLPPSQFGAASQPPMTPPPGGPTTVGGHTVPDNSSMLKMQPPPEQVGARKYNVMLPGQGVQSRVLTQDQVDALRMQGVKVVEQ